MYSFVTSKNVKWCHLIWPTLYNCQCSCFKCTDSSRWLGATAHFGRQKHQRSRKPGK